MATDSIKTSSDEEISFSEWQFVVNNKGDCSDDESIEIIEREVLQSVTPSSCSEDEDEDEDEDEAEAEDEIDNKDDEVEIVDWEVANPIEDGRIQVNNEEFIVNPSVELDTDHSTNHCMHSSEDSHVAATSINNHFSRKILYSCVLAAIIGVIIHQYRGNLRDMLNRADVESNGTKLKIRSDVDLAQDLVDKREQIKKLGEKYELILSNTYIPKSNIYIIDMSVFQKILSLRSYCLLVGYSELCKTDIENIQPPALCTARSLNLKPLLFMGKLEYNGFMRKVLTTLQFDEDEMHEWLHNLVRLYTKLEDHIEPAALERLKIDLSMKNPLDQIIKDDPLIKDDALSKNPNTQKLDNFEHRELNEAVELHMQEIIEGIRTLDRKIDTQVDDFHRLLTTCNKNEQNSCVTKKDSPSQQNDNLATESEKINATHNEETNSASVSEFIYKSAPITDRWSLKMDSEPSKDSKSYYKSSGEWLLKMGKAREKYRKRYKEKCKKKTHKSYDKSVHEIYKRYREFITRTYAKTQEKIKVDYKKYASQFKSKLKKFGDGMKRSYEKFISSDWKHYARSVFSPFRF